MNAKGFIALSAVTLVVTAAAVAVVVDRAQSRGADHLDALLLPSLLDKANDVTAIVVKSGDKTFTVTKNGKLWTIPDKSGYPALEDKVRKAIIDLARLRVVSEKTRMEDRYPRLQVEDPGKKDAKSTLVTLKAGESTVASAILGKRKFSATGRGGDGIYVRLPDQPQAWLAGSDLAINPDPLEWVDKTLFNVAESRAAEVRVVPKEGEQVIVVREEGKDKGFKLANPPAGKAPAKDAADKMRDLVTSFENVDLEDVRKASEVATGAPELTVTMVTQDGLIVEMNGYRVDKEMWFTVDASADDATAPAPAPDKAPGAQGEAAAPTSGVPAEAAAIDKKTDGWAYKFLDWRSGRLDLKMAALVQ